MSQVLRAWARYASSSVGAESVSLCNVLFEATFPPTGMKRVRHLV